MKESMNSLRLRCVSEKVLTRLMGSPWADCTLEECFIRQQWSSSTSPCQAQALTGSTGGKCGLGGSTVVDLQRGS